MAADLRFKRGALSGLPSLAAGEPALTTDQIRLYLGSVGGNRLVGLLHRVDATAAPGTGDDSADGYSPGSLWVDATNDLAYVCLDASAGAAVWQLIGSGSTFSITGLTAADLDFLDEFPLYDVSAAANRKVTLDRLVARAATPPPGRLTLSATLPVTTADTTSSTYVYYLTGATGNDRIRLWDGTRWVVRPLGTGTAWTGSWSASTVYDLFAYADSAVADTTDTATDRLILSTSPGWVSGTPVYVTATGGGLTAGTVYYWGFFSADTGSFHTTQADAVAGTNTVDLTATISGTVYAVPLERVAWTNDTTRATALALADGAYYKSGDRTRLYLGTVRADTGGTLRDTVLERCVWNAYNRRKRPLSVQETTNSWSYNSNTWRSMNASTLNRVGLVVGLSEDAVRAVCYGSMNETTAGVNGLVGIGLDSTSANSAQLVNGGRATHMPLSAEYQGFPGVGYHYLQALERIYNAVSATFYGDAGVPDSWQAGIVAEVWG